jgi:hypothetical protein
VAGHLRLWAAPAIATSTTAAAAAAAAITTTVIIFVVISFGLFLRLLVCRWRGALAAALTENEVPNGLGDDDYVVAIIQRYSLPLADQYAVDQCAIR